MGIRQHYLPDYDLSIWVYGSVINRATLRESEQLLTQGGPWPVAARWFVDMTGVEKIDIHFPDMKRFTDQNRPVQLGNVKQIAIAVLYSSDVALGMVRMYETLMSEENMSVGAFRTLTECAEFLDVPEEILLSG